MCVWGGGGLTLAETSGYSLCTSQSGYSLCTSVVLAPKPHLNSIFVDWGSGVLGSDVLG